MANLAHQPASTWFADLRAVEAAVEAGSIKPAAAWMWSLITQHGPKISVGDLGRRMGGLSASQVRRLRKALEAAGLIHVEREVLRRNRYAVPVALHLVARKNARPDVQERPPTPPPSPPKQETSRDSGFADQDFVQKAVEAVHAHQLALGKPAFLPTPQRRERLGEVVQAIGSQGLARALAAWTASPWLRLHGDVGVLLDPASLKKLLAGGYAPFASRPAKRTPERRCADAIAAVLSCADADEAKQLWDGARELSTWFDDHDERDGQAGEHVVNLLFGHE